MMSPTCAAVWRSFRTKTQADRRFQRIVPGTATSARPVTPSRPNHACAANRARITADAAIALSQHGTVAPVTLFQRTDFAASMTDGRTVQELDANGKSAQEVTELWKYVSTQLRK